MAEAESLYTASSLLQESQPVYMAVKGVVFDVTRGKGEEIIHILIKIK